MRDDTLYGCFGFPLLLRSVSRRLHRHRDGNREGLQVGYADVEGAEAEEFGATFGVAVQDDGWAAAAQLRDLHFAPGHTVDAGTQGLADGFLGGESPGETCCLAPALAYFHLGVDAPQEPLAVMLVDLSHAVNLDDVDADGDIDTLWCVKWRRQTGNTCRPEEPVGDGDPRLAHKWREDQRCIILVVHVYALSRATATDMPDCASQGDREGRPYPTHIPVMIV